MKARIKVKSYDTSIWGGMEPKDYQENVHLVAEGDSISTLALGRPYQFEVVAIRPDAVDLIVCPNLWFQAPGGGWAVGRMTLEVGEQACLQTQSFDAWGNWVVALVGLV